VTIHVVAVGTEGKALKLYVSFICAVEGKPDATAGIAVLL
jgi:hypothetical protein